MPKNKTPLRITATIPARKIEVTDLPAVLAWVRLAIETMTGPIGPVTALPVGDGAMTSGAAARRLGISTDTWRVIVQQRKLTPIRRESIGSGKKTVSYWAPDQVEAIAQERKKNPPKRGRKAGA